MKPLVYLCIYARICDLLSLLLVGCKEGDRTYEGIQSISMNLLPLGTEGNKAEAGGGGVKRVIGTK